MPVPMKVWPFVLIGSRREVACLDPEEVNFVERRNERMWCWEAVVGERR